MQIILCRVVTGWHREAYCLSPTILMQTVKIHDCLCQAVLAYRWKDALIPVVKLKSDKLSIGLSYDVNISKLSTASAYRGGFELTLTYSDLWNAEKIEASKVKCPVNLW